MKSKKLFITVVILFSVGAIILAIFDARYPFHSPEVGRWSVGVQKVQNPLEMQKPAPENIITYEAIDSLLPKDIDYIADPFFLQEKDTFYLFVEVKGEGNANIAVLTSPDGKSYRYKGTVLDEPFHLSFPQVFRHEGEYYMLPETKGSNNVLLYKAENFPYTWSVNDTLLKNRALKDPALLLSDELNLLIAVDDDMKQYMFTADSLKGDWLELKNYKQDWGNETRPGGRFFEINDIWYLPLQNTSLGYGTGISIYELRTKSTGIELKLSEELFLGPQSEIAWFNRGMHHLDVQKSGEEFYMVYDGGRNLNNTKKWQYKWTLKNNIIDLYNYLVQ